MVRRLALAAPLLGLLVACGGEEPLLDDGTQGVPLAGQGAALEEAGVEVLSAAAPAGASGADVTGALEAQDLPSGEIDQPADLSPAAGLVTTRGDGDVVVMVFDGPASAALFAVDADPAAPGGGTVETYLAGNVVGIAFDHGALVRRALRDLAGEG